MGGSNSYHWTLIVAIFSVCFGLADRLARIGRTRFSVRNVVYHPLGLANAIDLLQNAEISLRSIRLINLLISVCSLCGWVLHLSDNGPHIPSSCSI